MSLQSVDTPGDPRARNCWGLMARLLSYSSLRGQQLQCAISQIGRLRLGRKCSPRACHQRGRGLRGDAWRPSPRPACPLEMQEVPPASRPPRKETAENLSPGSCVPQARFLGHDPESSGFPGSRAQWKRQHLGLGSACISPLVPHTLAVPQPGPPWERIFCHGMPHRCRWPGDAVVSTSP